MNKLETEALLAFISTLDQRIVSEDVVESWHRFLENVSPYAAKQAVEEHFAAKPDTYIKVGHVLQGAKKFMERQAELSQSKQRELEESEWIGDPQPVCKEHSLKILECDTCCDAIFWQVGHWGREERHDWAVKNIYKPEILEEVF